MSKFLPRFRDVALVGVSLTVAGEYTMQRRRALQLKEDRRFVPGSVQDSLEERLDTGDIVLFDPVVFDSIQPIRAAQHMLWKYLARSHWSHVGIIIRDPQDQVPYVLEYNLSSGLQMLPFDRRVLHSRSRIAVRQLVMDRTDEFRQQAFEMSQQILRQRQEESRSLGRRLSVLANGLRAVVSSASPSSRQRSLERVNQACELATKRWEVYDNQLLFLRTFARLKFGSLAGQEEHGKKLAAVWARQAQLQLDITGLQSQALDSARRIQLLHPDTPLGVPEGRRLDRERCAFPNVDLVMEFWQRLGLLQHPQQSAHTLPGAPLGGVGRGHFLLNLAPPELLHFGGGGKSGDPEESAEGPAAESSEDLSWGARLRSWFGGSPKPAAAADTAGSHPGLSEAPEAGLSLADFSDYPLLLPPAVIPYSWEYLPKHCLDGFMLPFRGFIHATATSATPGSRPVLQFSRAELTPRIQVRSRHAIPYELVGEGGEASLVESQL